MSYGRPEYCPRCGAKLVEDCMNVDQYFCPRCSDTEEEEHLKLKQQESFIKYKGLEEEFKEWSDKEENK